MDLDLQIRTELRKKALADRNSISEEMRMEYSQRIQKKTIDFLDSISAKFVHSYISFNSEVGTHEILNDLINRKIKVAVPITIGDANSQHMIHSRLDNLEFLRPGKFGVPEPNTTHEISIEKLDAVIIPMVAFDVFGMRLGYGKGFYDKFLSQIPTKVRKIGLAFSIQQVGMIPRFSHDQLINNIITEESNFILK